LLVFVPDEFIKTVAQKYKVPLRPEELNAQTDTVIRLDTDDVLKSYFESLLIHLLQTTPPAGSLLKLKFEELLLNILCGKKQALLKNYLSEICRSAKPSIREIMELNFFSNLSLDEFARLCARSLSSFKKEFHQVYSTTPGKWLAEKRLEYSYYLLETTDLTLDEICMESGFENQSHFNRVFKNRYGVSPGKIKVKKDILHEAKYSENSTAKF
jgi:AraC-like DNA-binding protein